MLRSAEALTEIMNREIRELVAESGAGYPSDLESTVIEKKALLIV
jgi:hypothetical protein